jgi:hypothetical protein
MENYKEELLEALYMLRNVMENYDTDIAHNILIDGGTDQSDEEMEEDVENYISVLNELIQETKKDSR